MQEVPALVEEADGVQKVTEEGKEREEEEELDLQVVSGVLLGSPHGAVTVGSFRSSHEARSSASAPPTGAARRSRGRRWTNSQRTRRAT